MGVRALGSGFTSGCKQAEIAHQWGDGKTNWYIHIKGSGIKSNEQVMLQRGCSTVVIVIVLRSSVWNMVE